MINLVINDICSNSYRSL